MSLRKSQSIVVALLLLILLLFMGVVVVVVEIPVVSATTGGAATDDTSNDTSSCKTKLQQLLDINAKRPYVEASMWLPSTIDVKKVDKIDIISPMGINSKTSSCPSDDDDDDNVDPTLEYENVIIGSMPQMNEEQSMEVLQTANNAWDKGTGIWITQYTTIQRIEIIYKVLQELQTTTKRDEIINILQWEIGKNYIDAASEFDRTMEFAKQIMNEIITNPELNSNSNNGLKNSNSNNNNKFIEYKQHDVAGVDDNGSPVSDSTSITSSSSSSSYTAYTKRTPYGIILMLAPYNYPMNECYATLIPALLLGNICIVKIPSVGGLVHLLTIETFAKYLPHGTINFLSGSGAKVLPNILSTGDIHGIAMIGSSKSADQLIQYHTQPHRFKTFLQLGAKNVAIVLNDIFHGVTEQKGTTIFKNMITESILGSLSYNGQRCTALKIFFIPRQNADLFISKFSKAVESLNIGLPWQNHTTTSTKKKMITYSQVTPLPNLSRIQFLKARIEDAVKKGANIMNRNGGTILGNNNNNNNNNNTGSTLMIPAVLYPVKPNMKLYTEEQFGPIIPIVPYDNINEVYEYMKNSEYAQQISIFGQDTKIITHIVDTFGSVIPKINFNSQCARSPDILPFAARRSSGHGIMSVSDILNEFSVPTVLAYQNKALNDVIVQELFQKSTFLGATKDEATTTTK